MEGFHLSAQSPSAPLSSSSLRHPCFRLCEHVETRKRQAKHIPHDVTAQRLGVLPIMAGLSRLVHLIGTLLEVPHSPFPSSRGISIISSLHTGTRPLDDVLTDALPVCSEDTDQMAFPWRI